MFIPFEVEANTHDQQERPWLTWFLVVSYLFAYLYTGLYLDEATRHDIFYRFGIQKMRYKAWAAFTCTFLHAGFVHFAGNTFFLWLYGGRLEKLIGSVRFAVLYLVGAFLSVNLHLLTTSSLMADEPCIGASGAIAAVLGCVFVMLPTAKIRCAFYSVLSFRPIAVTVPAWLVLGFWLLGQLAYSLGLLGEMGGVAFWAHVAGFAAGAGIGSVLQFGYKRRLKKWMAAVRLPLATAWDAIRAQQASKAQRALSEAPDINPEARPYVTLVQAMSSGSAADFLRAYTQARDYHADTLKLSVYLQMLCRFELDEFPAAIHRDAGFEAHRRGLPGLALQAFDQSLDDGGGERLDQLLAASERILAKLGDEDGAGQLCRLRQEANVQ